MSNPLKPNQVKQYRDEGYTIAPEIFNRLEVEAMQSELERLHAKRHGQNVCPLPEQQNFRFTLLDGISSLYGAIPFHPKLVAALRQLIGDPLLLWLDQIYLKPAQVGAGNSWHEDNARFKAPDVGKSAGVWIAIHDAYRSNGTLELVPGSFRDSKLDVPFRIPAPREERQAVAAEMAAGGVAFFNFGTLHCTRDNLSDLPRAAAAYHFLRADNLPAEQFMGNGRNIPLPGLEN